MAYTYFASNVCAIVVMNSQTLSALLATTLPCHATLAHYRSGIYLAFNVIATFVINSTTLPALLARRCHAIPLWLGVWQQLPAYAVLHYVDTVIVKCAAAQAWTKTLEAQREERARLLQRYACANTL